MITVPAVLGKLNSISKSDETLIRDSVKHTSLFRLKCPTCGAVGRCRSSGSYRRMMITVVANERREIELDIPRVCCESCRHTHSLLADALIPYGSYTLRFILHVLYAYLHRSEPVAKICEQWAISISTLYSWIHLFFEQHNIWVRVLDRISWVTEAALRKIEDIPCFPARFLERFQFSFFRWPGATRSHPKGCRGGVFFCPAHNSEIDL